MNNTKPTVDLAQLVKESPDITQLDLGNNQISDISILKELTNLIKLDLGNNQISDISILKELINLNFLTLSYNQISDVSFLKLGKSDDQNKQKLRKECFNVE